MKSIAALVGNWNDRHSHHDGRHDATRRWRLIDGVVSWFYVRGF